MTRKKVMKLASEGRRLIAYLIDHIPAVLLAGVLAVFFVFAVSSAVDSALITAGAGSAGRGDAWIGAGVALFFGLMLLAFLGTELYFFSRSQTIGKAILGLQVVDARTGQPIGLFRMLLRELLVKRASASVFLLGYFWVLIDRYDCGWHDKILETYVIDLRSGVTELSRWTEPHSPEATENPEPAEAPAFPGDGPADPPAGQPVTYTRVVQDPGLSRRQYRKDPYPGTPEFNNREQEGTDD